MRDCCRITAPINGEFATEARPRLDSPVCVMEVGNKSQPNLALQVWPICRHGVKFLARGSRHKERDVAVP
jgi:hypothetical protein